MASTANIAVVQFVIFFERRFFSIARGKSREGKASFKYSFDPKALAIEVDFKLFNLPTEPSDKFAAVAKHYSLPFSDVPFASDPFSFGVMEIDFDPADLQKIFRSIPKHEGTELLLKQHLKDTGRSEKQGPTSKWLVENAQHAISAAVQDVGNKILEIYCMDYGEGIVGHLEDWALRREVIVRYLDEHRNFVACSVQKQGGKSSFSEQGKYFHSKLEDPEYFPKLDFSLAIQRARTLISLGFSIEALVSVNAHLESSLRVIFMRIDKTDTDFHEFIANLGYDKIVEISKKIVRLIPDDATTDVEFYRSLATKIEKIYEFRNYYVHQLSLPESEGKIGPHFRRRINELTKDFLDPFWSRVAESFPLIPDQAEAKKIILSYRKRDKGMNLGDQ